MIHSSAHWRQCANQCRRLADQSRDPLIRNTILGIVLSYERLAIHAETEDTIRRREPELAEGQKLQTVRVSATGIPGPQTVA